MSNPEQHQSTPPSLMGWQRLRAEVQNIDDVLRASSEGPVKLVENGSLELAKHIASYAINAYPVRVDSDDEYDAIGYSGSIDFTGPLHRDILATMFDAANSKSLIPPSHWDGPFEFERISGYNAMTMKHAYGERLVAYSSSNRSRICVVNKLKGWKNVPDMHPLPNDELDPRAGLEVFMSGFMRTLMYAAFITQENPSQHGLTGAIRIDGDAIAKNGNDLAKPAEVKTTLEDIGGLDQQREVLRQAALTFKHPEIMEKWGAQRPQGILLHGPPGTGKTMLIQALANEIGATLWEIQSSDIYDKWLGKSEKRIKKIFTNARSHDSPLVVFFDEFDAIFSIDKDDSASRNSVAGIFKQEMNSLYKANPNVIVAGATNNLDAIDPSLRRSGRFDYVLGIPLPDTEGRSQILAGIVQHSISSNSNSGTNFEALADDLNLPTLVERTEGFSGADLSELFRRLKLTKAITEARTGEAQPPINQADILSAIQAQRQSGSIG